MTTLGSQMKLSHIGIIVKDMEQGIRNHEKLFGYKQRGPVVEDTIQRVRVVLMGTSEDDPVKIELISPLGEDSPVADLLKKRQVLYHLCYSVPDIEEAKAKARESGAVIISQPVEAPLFDNRRICFLFTRDHYVIELVEGEH
jgi:methylmalonyl-CoA/ethylmalonyl-CoA epimerase